MKKFIFALALAFAFVGTASAANLTADAIFDGQTDLYGTPNASKTVKGHFQVDAGEVLHAIRTDFLGDNLPAVCHDVTNVQGAQETDRSVSVKLPPNTGDYGFELVPYVAANMNEANAMQGSAACQGTTGTVYNNGNVVHVIPSGNNSNNDDEVGGDAEFTAILTSIDQLNSTLIAVSARLEALENPTPTASGKCATLAQKLVGTLDFGRNEANTRLQGYLLSENMSIPALAAGASFGYKGPHTNAAISAFKSANGCS